MPGKVFNIQRFSVNDGPGIRTTVFFSGCPLRCIWCHNPESFSPAEDKNYFASELASIIQKDILFYEESGGGVTFSGGEPLLQSDFLREMLCLCKKMDISTAVDTSGFASFEDFRKIIPCTDLFLYDLKIMDEGEHIRHTGVSNDIILENLKKLADLHNNINIRIPLIPDITDTPDNLNNILEFISSVNKIRRVTLLPYNELCRNKYVKLNKSFQLGNSVSQSGESLNKLSEIFSSNGYEVNIRG